MQATKPLSNKAKLILRLYEATKSVRQTADSVPCSLPYAYSVLRRTGKWPPDIRRRPLHGKEHKIRRLYRRGFSLSQLASKYNVSKVAIFKALRREERARNLIRPSDWSSAILGSPMAIRQRDSSDFPSSSAIDRLIGERIRLRRNMLRCSRAKLARALKLSVRQIEVFENSGIGITTGILFSLSRVLEMPIRSFYDDLPPNLGLG